jgi:hypothetical protein
MSLLFPLAVHWAQVSDQGLTASPEQEQARASVGAITIQTRIMRVEQAVAADRSQHA